MFGIAKRSIACLAFALVLVAGIFAYAQQANGPAPLPSAIVQGRRVFISNTAGDSTSTGYFCGKVDPVETYTDFYSAVKSWGRYELVSSPAESDLVFEIRFIAAPGRCDYLHHPYVGLQILDAKSHFTLWTMVAPVESANLRSTWQKNLKQGVDTLVGDLKKLVSENAL